jgi:hypothetical protein
MAGWPAGEGVFKNSFKKIHFYILSLIQGEGEGDRDFFKACHTPISFVQIKLELKFVVVASNFFLKLMLVFLNSYYSIRFQGVISIG